MTTQEFCRLTADEQYIYVESLHQFVDAVRRMREVQKDIFHSCSSLFDKWDIEYEVDCILKKL